MGHMLITYWDWFDVEEMLGKCWGGQNYEKPTFGMSTQDLMVSTKLRLITMLSQRINLFKKIKFDRFKRALICARLPRIHGDPSEWKRPPIGLVPTVLASFWPLLRLPTAQAGWWNIPNLSQREVFTILTCHPALPCGFKFGSLSASFLYLCHFQYT